MLSLKVTVTLATPLIFLVVIFAFKKKMTKPGRVKLVKKPGLKFRIDMLLLWSKNDDLVQNNICTKTYKTSILTAS